MKIEEVIKYLVDYYKGNTENEDVTIYIGNKWSNHIQQFLWNSEIVAKRNTNYTKPCVYLIIVPLYVLENLRQEKSNTIKDTLFLDIRQSKTWTNFKKTFMEYYYV